MTAATLTDGLWLDGLEIRAGARTLVHDVDLALEAGRIVGLVGASGSGKTLTARSLLGMVDLRPGVVRGDLVVRVDGKERRPYADAKKVGVDAAFRGIRGDVVGYLAQDARAALDPLWTVGRQVSAAAALAPGAGTSPDPLPWLARAGLPDPGRVAALYPHELSGGMAQRVVLAQTLARGSRFLLADEPTSALDPTVQVEILAELAKLARTGIGILFITHDLRLLPGFADEVVVVHGGTVVERTSASSLVGGHVTSEPARRLLDATRRVAAGRLG